MIFQDVGGFLVPDLHARALDLLGNSVVLDKFFEALRFTPIIDPIRDVNFFPGSAGLECGSIFLRIHWYAINSVENSVVRHQFFLRLQWYAVELLRKTWSPCSNSVCGTAFPSMRVE